MFKRWIRIAAAALCASALSAVPMPQAHAQQSGVLAAYRATQTFPAQGVDPTTAQRMLAPFQGAFHVLRTEYGITAWVIYMADGQTLLAFCPRVQQDPQTGGWIFAGQVDPNLGMLYGGQLFGRMIQYQGRLWVSIQVQSPNGAVAFWQTVEPLQYGPGTPGGSYGGG
jgi:hypothetical protein